MSTYDRLSSERSSLFHRCLLLDLGIGFAVALLLVLGGATSLPSLLVLVAGTLGSAACSHALLKAVSVSYAARVTRIHEIDRTRNAIAGKVAAEHSLLPSRKKGQLFKTAYALSGRNINDFERVLGTAMLQERREVWVTAFVRNGVVQKVNAAIGWESGCRPAEDVCAWASHADRLGSNEVRHYHNHPTRANATSPSAHDYRASRTLDQFLAGQVPLRSFIFYWNAIGEWRIIEYSVDGRWWLHHVHDAAA
jgi:hypothetical protein